MKGSANIFEQKIENMLRHYGALKTEDISESEPEPEPQPEPQSQSQSQSQMRPSPSLLLSPKPAVATPPLHVEPLHAQENMYEGDEQLEHALKEDKVFQKQTQVVIPRTKPIESFQDVINLSKALEQEQTKSRS